MKLAGTALADSDRARLAESTAPMATATLTLTSKNYSSWSLRGWLLTKFSGLKFEERIVSPDDPAVRAEILLLSASIRVPCLTHNGISVWDTLAIGEYLNEVRPRARLLPRDPAMRAHCRSICGEMHSGFAALRSALPMNLKARFRGFKVWTRAQADIERVAAIWNDCLGTHGGPFLFGERSMADAMYAPVATRFVTYDIKLDRVCSRYCRTILALPEMKQWTAAARKEPDEIDELEVEF